MDAIADTLSAFFFDVHPEVDAMGTSEPFMWFMLAYHMSDAHGSFRSEVSIATTCSILAHLMRMIAARDIHHQWRMQRHSIGMVK